MAPKAIVNFNELPTTFIIKGGHWIKKRSFEVHYNVTGESIAAKIQLKNSFNALPKPKEVGAKELKPKDNVMVSNKEDMRPRYVKVNHSRRSKTITYHGLDERISCVRSEERRVGKECRL